MGLDCRVVCKHYHGGPGFKGQDKVSDKREMVVELSDPVAAEFPVERFFFLKYTSAISFPALSNTASCNRDSDHKCLSFTVRTGLKV